MLSSRVMCLFPSWIDDRAFSNFDNTIAGIKSYLTRCVDKFYVSPLITMMVDVIRNLAEQDTLSLQDSI